MSHISLHWVALVYLIHTASAALASPPIFLQKPHPTQTPSETLSSLAEECVHLGVESFDVYGDFHVDKDSSYLRTFEAEIAHDFGMEDAVFMPSGVMAQSIALLIHSSKASKQFFACHHSSHLLLHEDDGYRELLHKEPCVISTKEKPMPYRYGVQPMELGDVTTALGSFKRDHGLEKAGEKLSTLILELPHRELGGKLTRWDDVLQMRALCIEEGIRFHCDGARIFEAGAGYGLGLRDMAKPFDSVYISFYKGLGGISGAMLLGNQSFCTEARKWLRRFGGNLYTLMPYAVSGWSGYQKHVKGVGRMLSFEQKREKMRRIVGRLSETELISSLVAFDPPVPETNMVHGLLRASAEECLAASQKVEERSGICVLSRLRDIETSDPAYPLGFRSKFEISIGDANGVIDDETFFSGWKDLASVLSSGTK